MKIFENFKKRRALKSYILVLPRLLKKRYGKRKRYTEGQVRKTIAHTSLNMDYIDYALAMYISREDFDSLIKKDELIRDYDEARQEIADKHFDGNSKFTIHDITNEANSSSSFLSSDSDFDSGNDFGGDGGDF